MDEHHEESDHGELHTSCIIDVDYDARRISLFLIQLFILTVGLVLNTTVVWVNWRRRHSRNTVFFCLLNLGMSDLLMLVVCPFNLLDIVLDQVWLWGQFLCRFNNFICVVNIYSNSFFLAYMTIERYLTVKRGSAPKPWGLAEKRKRALITVLLWLLSVFLSSLESAHMQVLEWTDPGCYIAPMSDFEAWYVTICIVFLTFQFIVPGAIIITFNTLTARAVQASPLLQGSGSKSMWLLHAYSLVFVVCWLPYNLVALLIMVDFIQPGLTDCYMLEHLFFSYSVVQSFALFHCLANPILYSFLSRSFRSHLISAIYQQLPKEAVDANGADAHGTMAAVQGKSTPNAEKARRASDTSTSHSEVVS